MNWWLQALLSELLLAMVSPMRATCNAAPVPVCMYLETGQRLHGIYCAVLRVLLNG